ncbi:MAG: hypothetical protein O4805_02710 [Trichodesmium sp. St16_bin2-tuft]|nr:hypothetical protein [Trichodesmium sp. St5_bin2_1]MDE5086112.1 hypothetical protein [Trichodesmium sp. St16_bin2-tuft]MDE5111996.1 hypothetical protein [Trichodesmium sp. St7_bin2_1]
MFFSNWTGNKVCETNLNLYLLVEVAELKQGANIYNSSHLG